MVGGRCHRTAAWEDGPWLRSQRGLTLIELSIATAIMALVVTPCVSIYIATTRSWEGTEALANVQRDASFAVDVMVRSIRGASRVDVSVRPDSMDVIFRGTAGDSVGARYYVNGQNELVDINGEVIVEGVDSAVFSLDGSVVSIDITLTDDSGTPFRWTDDQSVLMSSSVVCRNP